MPILQDLLGGHWQSQGLECTGVHMTLEIDKHLISTLDSMAVVVLECGELTPRWDVHTPKGTTSVFVGMSDDLNHRVRHQRMLTKYMAWKQATAFTMVVELKEPDAMAAVYVSREKRRGLLRLIQRAPIRIGKDQWIDQPSMGLEMVDKLPVGPIALSSEEIKELESMFGPDSRSSTNPLRNTLK